MYNYIDQRKLSWTQDHEFPMRIIIMYDGHRIMELSIHEAMEFAGRKNIMAHVRECDRTPWLSRWTEEAMDDVVEVLKKG